MIYLIKKFIYLTIFFFILNSCSSLPGVNKSPTKKKPNNKILESEYSMKDGS